MPRGIALHLPGSWQLPGTVGSRHHPHRREGPPTLPRGSLPGLAPIIVFFIVSSVPLLAHVRIRRTALGYAYASASTEITNSAIHVAHILIRTARLLAGRLA